jgi:hypothetical protein
MASIVLTLPTRRERRRAFLDDLKAAVPVYAITESTAEVIGKIGAESSVMGVAVPFDDLLNPKRPSFPKNPWPELDLALTVNTHRGDLGREDWQFVSSMALQAPVRLSLRCFAPNRQLEEFPRRQSSNCYFANFGPLALFVDRQS